MRVFRYSSAIESLGSHGAVEDQLSLGDHHADTGRPQVVARASHHGNLAGLAGVLMHPPIERSRFDEQELPTRDDAEERLNVALKMSDAHPHGSCRLSARQEPTGHSLDRTVARSPRQDAHSSRSWTHHVRRLGYVRTETASLATFAHAGEEGDWRLLPCAAVSRDRHPDLHPSTTSANMCTWLTTSF